MNRQQRRSVAKSTGAGSALLVRIRELEQVRDGSYALIRALVARQGGGPIEIPRVEWQSPPPNEKLDLVIDEVTGDARLAIMPREADAGESRGESPDHG